MKLLLYCTKSKPYLYKGISTGNKYYTINEKSIFTEKDKFNGKIVGECDYEVHKIIHTDITDDDFSYGYYNDGKNVRICTDSCLTKDEIFDYLYDGYVDNGYAICIKNLNIFDEPKELSDYEQYKYEKRNGCYVFAGSRTLENAPKNMCYVYDNGYKCVLISIHPELLCKKLNGECTIIVKKTILKGMLL